MCVVVAGGWFWLVLVWLAVGVCVFVVVLWCVWGWCGCVVFRVVLWGVCLWVGWYFGGVIG